VQHLKRRPKRCVEVQDSRRKEAKRNTEAVSQRSGGAADSGQYISGVHRTVRCETRQSEQRACNQGLSGSVAPDSMVPSGARVL
jgi:hypothetical protein